MGACASWLHLGTPNKQCPDRYSGGKLAMPLSPSWERSFQSVYCLEFQCKCEEQGDGGKNKGKGGRDRQKKKKKKTSVILSFYLQEQVIFIISQRNSRSYEFLFMFFLWQAPYFQASCPSHYILAEKKVSDLFFFWDDILTKFIFRAHLFCFIN